MTDLELARSEHQPWIDRACAAVDVEPALVDVPAIHALTKVVAHDLARPMAPVAAYILGLSVGRHGAPTHEGAAEALAASVTPASVCNCGCGHG